MAAGFTTYLKKAFFFHWNLLIFGSAALFGVVSGHADIVLPVVAASEILYLSALSTRPRFQSSVDAAINKSTRSVKSEESTRKAEQFLFSLSKEDRKKFNELKGLCIKLQNISQRVKSGSGGDPQLVGDIQSAAVNKLLWLFLRLLYSKGALSHFFEAIDSNEIERNMEATKEKIAAIGPVDEDTVEEIKRRKVLEDTLHTGEARLKNYQRAKDNYELIELELDRLYSKIAGLSEMSINWQDPNFITNEVDGIAASVKQTERAIGELDFLKDLAPIDDAAPELLTGDDIATTMGEIN